MAARSSWLLLGALPAAMAAQARAYPQYLVLNKANFVSDPFAFDQDRPNSASQESIDQLLSVMGGLTGSDKRRLAFSHITLLMGSNATNAMAFLNNMLNLSLANNLALSVELDVFQWWNGRPDLWNWFNTSAPGYSPSTVANVEWTCWQPECATMLSWRNWGSQFRTPAPHPNIASPVVMAEYLSALRPFLARVGQWYASLPADKRYLLAALKVSEEVDIGPNFFFYPDGNSYIGQPAANDPKTGIADSVQQGYNAVCTAGLACSGNITRQQLDTVVQQYYTPLATAAMQACIPRNKIVAHIGADFGDGPPQTVNNGGMAAVTTVAAPAYSIYRDAADPSPAGAGGLDVALDAIEGSAWAVGEWYLMGANHSVQQWASALNNTFAYRNCRQIFVFNYEAFYKDANALAAAVAALGPAAAPPCLVEPASGLSATVYGPSQNGSWPCGSGVPGASFCVSLSWSSPPLDADASYLDVSTLPYLLPSGALASSTVVPGTALAPGAQSFAFPLLGSPSQWNGTSLYASIRSKGCGGGSQMMASDAFSLPIAYS